MFAYELPLEPPCNEWEEYRLPNLCKQRIEAICHDILKRGENTRYGDVYDAIYQVVQENIEEEYFKGYIL